MIYTADGLVLNMEAGNPALIHASGELNYCNCDSLHDLISSSFQDSVSTVSLDLSKLEFVDSSGLRILAIAASDAHKLGRSIRIVALTRQLSHALDISDLRSLFEISCSVTEVGSPEALCPPLIAPQSLDLAPGLDSCREARQAVCGYASSMGFDETALDDIRLAVGEAISNAVRHGSCGDHHIRICCSQKDGGLCVTLNYRSCLFDPDVVPVPDLESSPSGGMGIYFMKLVMDSVDYNFEGDHVTVTLEKALPTPVTATD